MKPQELRDNIRRMEETLGDAKRQLALAEKICHHKWGATFDASIYHPAYTIPGDPPGTMGVDWRGPCYVEARTERRWKRTCMVCGKEEIATQTNKTTVETPVFS